MGGCLGENGYTCMSESLHCSPETSTALLVSYTPIQNVLGAKNKQMKIKENKNDPSYWIMKGTIINYGFLKPDS